MNNFYRIIFLFIWGGMFSLRVVSQVNVTFQIIATPLTHKNEKVFIAGSFNSWSPNSVEYSFPPSENGISSFTTKMAKGFYEYKFTRGDWTKCETKNNGKDIDNHSIRIVNDTTILVSIAGWKDDFAQKQIKRKHTASKNVSLLDTAFLIPQLNRTRRIWVYLPKDYKTGKRFPVIYMHDGQNLFDESVAGFGEWGVDEFLDSLPSNKESIIIGIDNGGTKRMSEYNPYEFRNFGKGEGDLYVDFLAKTLKPFIDKRFHTIPSRANTFVAGSSMGGLISLYAVLKYPLVFGGAGIFSPAFWTASGIDEDVKKLAPHINGEKLFFYAGGKESNEMIPDMKRIESILRSKSPNSGIKEITDPEAQHNEAAWRKYFPQFYYFIRP